MIIATVARRAAGPRPAVGRYTLRAVDWPLSGTCGIGTGHARVSILFVARRESAWAGIILFPHGQTSYEIVVNQGPAVLWPGVAVASLLRKNAG